MQRVCRDMLSLRLHHLRPKKVFTRQRNTRILVVVVENARSDARVGKARASSPWERSFRPV